ncbi:putative 39S ribosomal protein L24, mitochondrial [Halotydeus destructor]|nr:putative 39S ribosomal protein L24, mitochondrial [Halotydeus destructor]
MKFTNILFNTIKKLPKNYANFPHRYVKKHTEFIKSKPPMLPNYQHHLVERYREHAYYDDNEPWTHEFKENNAPSSEQPFIWVEPHKIFPVFVGDFVELLAGKDAGKQGVVRKVVKERNWVYVEQLNIKYTIRDGSNEDPGLVSAECMPLLYGREVRLVDPSDRKSTPIEWRFDEDGNEIRVSQRTGRIIPIPPTAFETYDYKVAEVYVEQAKDTTADEIKKVTFEPEAKTFEMDIMEAHGIKEERVPYKFFWY